jgi:hypothetical protein
MQISKITTVSPEITLFYGESPEDLALMPTTTKEGEGQYRQGFAEKGSIAQILTQTGLKIYMLRTTGWMDITGSQILEFLLGGMLV